MRVLRWYDHSTGWVARVEDDITLAAMRTQRFADVFLPSTHAKRGMQDKRRYTSPVYVTFYDKSMGMPRFPSVSDAKRYVESIFALES